MTGVFGVVSRENCINDLFLGTFYLQHRAQDYCGLAVCNNGRLRDHTHKGLIRQQFPKEELKRIKGNSGIGSVSSYRQPISELARFGGIIVAYDGNVLNAQELKERMLVEGITFSGYHDPEEVSDNVLVPKIIAKQDNFAKGVKKLVELMKGDFAIIALTKDGIYAARGWGRKPLILGKKDKSFAVSSESCSFENSGFETVRDLEPGEIVFLSADGIKSVEKLNLAPVKYGTFEWIYTAYPVSIIDGRSVSEVRKKIGAALAKRYPVDADLVSPVPNSGRWHAIGYAEASGIPYAEAFSRYDYSDRSFTPQEQVDRDEEARIKLLPIKSVIKGKKIILVDDSIVRGTQTLNQVRRLKEFGAREVHARIACPPLMVACSYGKTTRKDEDCIAKRMNVEEIRTKLGLDSLGYATVEDLEKAIGYPKEKLCLDCWGV